MKCPYCGNIIADDATVCDSCNRSILEADSLKTSADSESISSDNAEILSRKSRQTAQQKEKPTRSSKKDRSHKRGSDQASVEASSSKRRSDATKDKSIDTSSAAQKEETPLGQAFASEEPAAIPQEDAKETTYAESSELTTAETSTQLTRKQEQPSAASADTGKTSRRFLIWFAVFFSIGAIGLLADYLVRKNFVTWQRFYNVVMNIHVDPPEVEPAIVEVLERDGKYIRSFTVRGDDSYTLVIDSLGGKEVKFKDGAATIEIEDTVWIPESPEPDVEYIEINLKMRVMDELGYSTEVPVDSFLVYVPETPVVFESPTTLESRVFEDQVDLVFSAPELADIGIDGNVISSATDEETGMRTETIGLEMGENKVTFTASLPYTRAITKEFVFQRTLEDVIITLTNTVPSRTTANQITVTGKVEPGATLTSEFDGIDQITLNSSTGEFSFTAKLSALGMHSIVLHSEMENKEPTDFTIKVERIPDAITFSQSAIMPDLQEFFANPGNFSSNNLYFEGTPHPTDDANIYQLMIGDNEYYLFFEYNGPTSLSPDETIRIYGNYVSMMGEDPKLLVWFITK